MTFRCPMRLTMKTSHTAIAVALLLALPLAMMQQAAAQSFSEPATVFYGKVLGTGSAQDFLITEGSLRWTIRLSDGSALTLNTALFSFGEGTLSYRLEVPHSAFALGLDSDWGGIPMPPMPQTHVHEAITVDGEAAVILGPAGSTFTTEQLLRTSTYRLDLAIGREAVDSDSDGMADWWEDQYALDKQDPADAATDFTGDGLSALDAYLKGLDPRRDARAPALLTQELVVYRSGPTAVLLDASDLNSTPGQLRYTVTALPQAGTLLLRNARTNAVAPDVQLAVSNTFSHADLLAGRVLYQHDGADVDPGFFDVTLNDENPQNAGEDGRIQLLAYTPAEAVPLQPSPSEAQRLQNAIRSAWGHVVMDGSRLETDVALSAPSAGLQGADWDAYLSAFGNDRRHVLIGGDAAWTLTGGAAADLLVAGPTHVVMTGGADADTFLLRHFVSGRAELPDFDPAASDVLDLSTLAVGSSAYVQNYLKVVPAASGSELRIDLDGDGQGYTNRIVALPNLPAANIDLYDWVETGRLLVGSLPLEPQITVLTTEPQASENGPTSGRFTLSRRGSLDADLIVNVAWSGAAVNGVDYQQMPSSVVLPAGVASVDVEIIPNADSQTESPESVTLTVLPGVGFRVGAANQASLTIEDRLMLVQIEALEPIADKESGTPGYFVITRRDVLDRDVLIRLTIGGTAANGTDYTTISSFVLLGINQTTALVPITPKATATLAGGMETVTLSINADAAYRIVEGGNARVSIVERMEDLAGWRLREFPEDAGTLEAFAAADSGELGIINLQRYAYGLGADGADRSGLPQPVMLNGRFTVAFRRPVALTDVTYLVTAATNLLDWVGSEVPAVQVDAPVDAADPQRVYYQLAPAVADSPVGFLRVEVKWAP